MKILWIGALVLALAATMITSVKSRMEGPAQLESQSPVAAPLPAAAPRGGQPVHMRHVTTQ